MKVIKCICGNDIYVEPPKLAVCSKCGRIYLYKIRSKHYVFAGFRRGDKYDKLLD